MPRGVDAELFSPVKRREPPGNRDQVLGLWAGSRWKRTWPLLAQVQEELERLGQRSFHFRIVGHGGAEAWLRDGCRGGVYGRAAR